MVLSGFDYEVEYKIGSENVNVDCLSRAPADQKYYSIDIAINEVHQLYHSTIFEISSEELTAESIVRESDKDEVLSKIKGNLFNDKSTNIHLVDSECTFEPGMLFKDQLVVIPKALQTKVLEELHKTHVGTKMKQLARHYYIWKGIDKYIDV